MTLCDDDQRNLDMLAAAFGNRDIALIECQVIATGEAEWIWFPSPSCFAAINMNASVRVVPMAMVLFPKRNCVAS